MAERVERGTRDDRWITRMLRTAPGAVQIALRMLGGETVQLRAMALTYISLFALVPGLVVAFSVVQAFTGMQRISDRLHEFLFANLAVGARATIEPYLDRFIQNAHVTSAGLVGAALLVWSSVSLFRNVDRAVNEIWGVRRRRPLAQQATILWLGITLGPLLLAGSVMVGHSTRAFLANTPVRFLGTAAGALLTCTFFSVLYFVVPSTKVRLRNAVAAGVVAGVAWEVAKWGYTLFVAKSFRTHAIYGSVAAIPIFLLWLYLSWSILLFGARLAFVFQYASALIQAPHPRTRSGSEVLAGRAVLAIARAFDRGAEAPDPADVATELVADADDVSEVLAALKSAGVVVALADGGLVPARPLERITLLDVRRALAGEEPPLRASAEPVASTVKEVEDRAAERLSEITLRSLCDREPSRASSRPEGKGSRGEDERGSGGPASPPVSPAAEQGSARPVRSV
jgi:membrane protein